jgi:hypothetical protein
MEHAEDLIVCNLMEAVARLHDDLDRVEIWTAALGCFLRPVPEYQPDDAHLLPTPSRRQSRRGRS